MGICGHYGGTRKFLDGQTIKTLNVTEELRRSLGSTEVLTVDTYGGVKVIPKCLFGLFKMLMFCDNIIILPAQNSIRVFPLFLILLNAIFSKTIHYIVIGGWLPDLVQLNKRLAHILKKIDYIYVETSTMKTRLEAVGFNNVIILPNFKNLKILDSCEMVKNYKKPYKICTFSRVTEKKGIKDLAEAIVEVNRNLGEVAFLLDVFGQVDPTFESELETIVNNYESCVSYKGMVDSEKSVSVLADYFFLVFPTKFYTEGIPGTIIDSYSAGVPVVAAKWESFSDIIEEGVTGIGYEFNQKEDLMKCLLLIYKNPEIITKMKKACLCKAREYQPNVLGKILRLKFKEKR